MAKSLVEKYEQILSQDPASTVFVELAKALIDQGEHQRAIAVCEAGLSHHQKSVVGRVLWGKALINLGKPAEAMEQFDRAIGIDKENPHAYNLIGEVLLHKGLYRSALPLLRKAVALQPNDGRVRQWLDQTQRALSGGPAPVLADSTQVDLTETPSPTVPDARVPDVSKLGLGAPGDEQRDKTDVTQVPAFAVGDVPRASGAPATTLEIPGQKGAPVSALTPISSEAPVSTEVPTAEHAVGPTPSRKDIPVLSAAPNPAPSGPTEVPSDLFARVPKRTDSSETIRGLTATFNSLEDGAKKDIPVLAPAAAPKVSSEPSVVPSAELFSDAAPTSGEGLLGDLPPPAGPVPESLIDTTREKAAPKRGAPASSGGLLDDIPDAGEGPSSSLDMPKVELSSQATEAIAQEYERELREKLKQNAEQKTFLQQHGLKLAIGGILTVAVLVGLSVYVRTRVANQGRDLKDSLAAAKRGILLDSPTSYRGAFEAIDQAIGMDRSNPEVWALSAYAHAVAFAEQGGGAEHRQKAVEALGHEGVRDGFPHLSRIADYLVSDGREKDTARAAILSSDSDKAEMKEMAGEILLSSGKGEQAVAQLKAALERDQRNVRAMVTLAQYFQGGHDFAQALEWYENALQISPDQPAAIIGIAECRLEVGQDTDQSLNALKSLSDDGLNDDLRARKAIALARLLISDGDAAGAVQRLSDAEKTLKTRAFDFTQAMGEAQAASGQMDAAQKSFEAALKMHPRDEDAKEALGRILIARDRPREVLSRLSAEPGERKVSLVRGVAAAQAGEWRLARQELSKTQVSGKVPAEAVIYLALADAADGDPQKAQGVLERALAATRRNKTDVQVALGKVYLQQNKLPEARAQFEAAAKDPNDKEGSCQLGQLLLRIGLPDRAVDPLQRVVTRNPSHGEARHALVSALLDLGRIDDGLKAAEAGNLDNPASPVVAKDYALALYRAGRIKEADAASSKAVRLDPQDFAAFRVRAAVQFARGEAKDAMKSLERANKLNSKDPDTFCDIALALMRQGHPDYALQAYEAARREAPDSACAAVGPIYARLPFASKTAQKDLEGVLKSASRADDKAFALLTLARVQAASGAMRDARKGADDAVALAPYSGLAHFTLAQVLLKSKEDAQGKQELQRASELEPAFGPIRLAYADVLVRGTDDEQGRALAEYDAFLRAGGSDADVARVKKQLPLLKKKTAER